MASTFNTYPELIHTGGRLAQTVWSGLDPARAIAATLALDPDAVILRADGRLADPSLIGLAPGGLAA